MRKRCFLSALSLIVLSLVGCGNQGHSHAYDFDNPSWNWESVASGEGYTAKAILACSSCDEKTDGHFLTLDATVTQVTVNPTCENDGSITYTATATYQNKTITDTKVDTIQKLGHKFDTITVEGDYKKTYVALEIFDSSNLVVKGICSRKGCGGVKILSKDEYFIIYQTQGSDHLCGGDTKVTISANYEPFAKYEITGLTVTKIPNAINGMEDSYTTSCHHKPDLSGVTSTSGDLELSYYSDSSCTQEISLDNLSAGTYYIKATAGDVNHEIVSKTAILTVVHEFDKCVKESAYLHTAATKFENASYYKSCVCGASSSSENDVFVADDTKLPDTVAKSAFDNYAVVDMVAPEGYQIVSKNTATYGDGKQGFSFISDLDLNAIENKVNFMILVKNGSLCQKGWDGSTALAKDKWYSVEITKNTDDTYSSVVKDEEDNIKIHYSNQSHVGTYANETQDSTALPYYQYGGVPEIYSTEVYGMRCNDETFNQLVSDSAVPSSTFVDMISPKGYKTVVLNSKTFNDNDQGKTFLKEIDISNYASVSFAFRTKNRRFCKSDWSSPLAKDTWFIITITKDGGTYSSVVKDLSGTTKFSYSGKDSFSAALPYYNWDGSAPNLEWYSTEVRGVAL